MLTRNTSYTGRPNFIKDPFTVNRTGGLQIDWENVDADDYTDEASGKKIIPAGTAMGNLLSSGGAMSPRVVTTNPAIGFLEGDAVEDDLVASESGYGLIVGATLYENLLPDATGGPPATLAAGIKTELEDSCPRGFHFITYSDSRIP